MIRSAYIHLPFCKTHCPYCDFAVWVRRSEHIFEEYAEILCYEIAKRSEGEPLDTIYFGGGTPSLFPVESLAKILRALRAHFQVSPGAEITLEANPGTVDRSKLAAFRDLGVNRLSIGVQTFDSELLGRLARGHNLSETYEVLRDSAELGFSSISLDLIYGLPRQTLSSWEKTLDEALGQEIDHISVYALTIERGTPFQRLYTGGKHPDLPSEDLLYDMYQLLVAKTRASAFEQYEVSNFAKPGHESRHNLTYWRNQEYLGFGVSAHEYRSGRRRSHGKDLQAYLKDPLALTEENTNTALEELMLRLRLSEGIGLDEYFVRTKIDLTKTCGEDIEAFQKRGLVKLSKNRLSLTSQGFLLSNELIYKLSDRLGLIGS